MLTIRIGAAMLVLLAWWPMPVSAKRQLPAQCGTQTDGAIVTGTLSTQSKGKRPVQLDQAFTTDGSTGATSFDIAVTQGQQQVIHLMQTFAADGSGSGSVRFGSGFKGIGESSFTTDGQTAVLTVDGNRTQPFQLGAPAKSIRLEDGSALPRLHVRPSTRKALLKLAKRAKAGCPAPTSGLMAAIASSPLVPRVASHAVLMGTTAPLPDDTSECVLCQGKCASAWLACVASLATPAGWAAAIGGAIAGDKSCIELSEDCLKACHNGGGPCCPVKCGESCHADNSVCCPSDPNGFTLACAAGNKCALVPPPASFQVCCPGDAGDACAGGCCPQGDHCTGGACCPAGSGEYCGVLGCCPGGAQCHVAYEPETGDLLGRVCCDHETCGYEHCCAADETCTTPDQCCKKTDICPGSGICCPAPGECLADGECCPSGAQCGGSCCAFGSCCNGQCCTGLHGETCLAGVCCPRERACGSGCCPEGNYCTDPNTATCAPCDVGQSPCPFGDGGPACCPTGNECCGASGCCPSDKQCCSDGIGPVMCQPGFQCVH